MIRVSLKYRIALTILMLEVIMIVLVLWQTQREHMKATRQFIKAQEDIVLNILGDLSRFALITEEYGSLQPYIDHVQRDPDVIKIIIANRKDRVVASTDPSLIGRPLPPFDDTNGRFWRTHKLSNAAGYQGLLAIEFSRESLMQAYRESQKRGILIAAASMSIIALVGTLIGFMLTRRLGRLMEASRRLADGDLEVEIDVPGSDEVAALGNSFGVMAERIKGIMKGLRDSEEKYRRLFEGAHDSIFIVDHEMKQFIDCNENAAKRLGYSRNELIGRSITAIRSPNEPVTVEHIMQKLREDGNFVYETLHRRKDGSDMVVEVSAQMIEYGDEKVIQAVVRDITERESMEAFIRNILQSIGEAFVVISRDYVILMANRAYCDQTKMSLEQVIGRHCYEISHHCDRPCFTTGEVCTVHHTLSTGDSLGAVHTHYDRDGNPLLVETKSYPMRDSSGQITSVIEISIDITEKKKLESQLRHIQKMETIGTLAGGVAHDFNNILTAIIGYGNLALTQAKGDPLLYHYIEQILASSEKAAHLTQSLLAFSRKQIIDLKPVNLNSTVKQIEKLLLRVIGEDIELKVTIADRDLMVKADCGQLDQVLINLATNARDAMPDGGILSIEIGAVEIDAAHARTLMLTNPGAYALISVADTGSGMDEETKEKIFEPFFTTKEVGKGTGLGLAIVYGIVKQHDGIITVYSEPGRGSTFRIYLPLAAASAEEIKTTDVPLPKGGTETVLLAEDDHAAREVIKTTLEGAGYTVIETADGGDALAAFERHQGAVNLLLSDVVMPGMNGKELYEQIKKVKPDIRALFISGYTADILNKKGVLEPGINFISKPVSPHDLLRKIREVLDR
ncbi:MAG: PAS domain S-box protein [Nitrospirota bacterium]